MLAYLGPKDYIDGSLAHFYKDDAPNPMAIDGIRRQDAYASLKSLAASGLIESEDKPQDGNGKSRRVYRIKVP